MTASKSICSLSLDLDNQWSYMKTHGDVGWESFPSYLDLVVPRFLKILDDFGWKITVFVVGQDAAFDKNREALQMIADAGHEIGNHSFNHEPWLHLYSRQAVEEEIVRAEEAIESATGQQPRGFRGPGYSVSQNVLEVLANRDYLYDASTFPTYLGPLARAYYFLKTDLDDEEKERRKQLFGSFWEGTKSLKPYRWEIGDRTLLEIPVTTMPVFKLPIHFSYLLYISSFSFRLAQLYFKTAMTLFRITKVEPSLLMHPLDLLCTDDIPNLEFFPAMNFPVSEKARMLTWAFKTISRSHLVSPVGLHALQKPEGLSLRVFRTGNEAPKK